MKYLIPAIFCITVLISCGKDMREQDGIILPDTRLEIEDLKAYLPDALKSGGRAVYVDASSHEKTLVSTYVEKETEKSYTGQPYDAVGFEITLRDPDDSGFLIVLSGNAAYSNSKVVKSIVGSLMPFSSIGSTINIIGFENGVPNVDPFDDFHEELMVLERNFYDVYVGKGMKGNIPFDAYSELDLNSQNGVVAFRDIKNDLWVLDRYE